MARGRKTKIRISMEEFYELLRDKLVDSNGLKLSVTELLNDEEFQTKVGGISSRGTISYYTKKFNLHEEELWAYHKFISKKIGINMSLSKFSRLKNRGYKKGDQMEVINLEEIPKDKLAWVLRSISKQLNLEKDVSAGLDANSPIEDLKEYYKFLSYFYNDEDEYDAVFKERSRAFRRYKR